MKTKIILSLVLLLSLTAFSQPSKHTFSFDKQEFMLDGKPFQIISGEMHPARIPTEYWRHRIKMAKAMGCNTVAAYVFWNFHESDPGVFDFRTDRHNIAEFVRMVQEEGMWLILRPGPYVCAEWDFGGLPAYLLSIPDIKVRCMDPRYTQAAERYIRTLAMEIKPLLISEGGPILMVQIENEYGSYGNDRNYTSWLKEVWTRAGVSGPFYTADGATPYMLEAGTVAGAAIGLDPGTDDQNFAQATKVNPEVPSFCSELYPGWLTHWGESWQRPDTASLLKEVRWLMDHKKSFNFYVLTGGTNFGFWAGANTAGPNTYQPDVTSYDYDAPVNEMGQPTPKYLALRKLFESYLPKKQKLPAIPASPGVIALPEITLSRTASLWDALPAAQRSVQPKPMEMTGQKSGFILYRTHLIGHKRGKLRITELHDYATLFVDGKYIGKIDRSKGENSIDLPAAISSDPLLEILVEGMGRVNFAEYLIDRKGITDRVTLNGMTLMNWEIVNLPMEEGFLKNLTFDEKQTTRPGLFFKGSFELDKTGDTYLDVSKWEKGIAWINGHNLGRYWSIGPQKRLYCPASWLNKGSNEVILFDQHCLSARTICGVTALEP